MNKKINKIFKDIESIRSKNNKNWMSLLKLSYESQPKKTLIKINNAEIYNSTNLI